MLAPSERVVVDALFEQPGRLTLEHRTPERTYALATIEVGDEPATPPLAERVRRPAPEPGVGGRAGAARAYVDAAPDKTLAFVAEMDMGVPEGPVVYACPMHPEVTGEAVRPLPEVRHEAARGRRAERATPARCTRRSSATHRTAARSAA